MAQDSNFVAERSLSVGKGLILDLSGPAMEVVKLLEAMASAHSAAQVRISLVVSATANITFVHIGCCKCSEGKFICQRELSTETDSSSRL